MIVIPMAGLSSRFKNAGYVKPKYMLQAHGYSLFYYSIISFKAYFHTEKFLFIALDVASTKSFIVHQCQLLGITNYEIILLEEATKGQAETVYLGLKLAKVHDDSLLIFNIDTFRPGYYYPKEFDLTEVDGYLETFIGTGKNWSNVLPDTSETNKVVLTAEKKEISEYCCTGLYYWRCASDFMHIFENYKKLTLNQLDGREYYIAPMYNYAIEQGKDIRFNVINSEDVIFCGVPREYEAFCNSSEHMKFQLV
ncbi:glycosyltransferase family 2 protein [Thiotrichales bacterium 19S3-7]|nr:glycosyltransferase family 2 protein [Thiotrichales bacterium 19S3-7]MCF6800685.1 glycosyltransferase family 2 protein [Thiotrichales bacterium 19S3-11]